MNKKILSALAITMLSTPVLTGTVNADTGSNLTGNSTAILKIIKDSEEGSLALLKVPSFDFGNVNANLIMTGQTVNGNAVSGEDKLQVNDNRLAGSPGWKLSVNGTTLKDSSSAISLSNSELSFNTTSVTDLTNINLGDGSAVVSHEHTAGGSIEETVNASPSLKFGMNPGLNISADTELSSTLSWTLAALTTRANPL